jgi:hypothetical protein
MNDLVRALAISAGILVPVVILIVIVSMVAVRRGEGQHAAGDHEPHGDHALAKEAAPAAKTQKPAAGGAAVQEISVPMVLIGGVVLFTLTMLLLFGISLLAHL